MKAHILVAEDDLNIRTGLVDTLESEGYKVTASNDGEQTLKLALKQKFDAIVLDIMMPKKSGYDVCREIRAVNNEIPIIMLTAKSEEIDKVVGLELGADDYVTKPFGVHELLARIAAVLRRSKRGASGAVPGTAKQEKFRFGKAEIDTGAFTATLGRKTFELSAREVKLIEFFRANPGRVLSRDELLNRVWGVEYFGTTRTLDQHVAQLRKKIEPASERGTSIETVHGAGYRYSEH